MFGNFKYWKNNISWTVYNFWKSITSNEAGKELHDFHILVFYKSSNSMATNQSIVMNF